VCTCVLIRLNANAQSFRAVGHSAPNLMYDKCAKSCQTRKKQKGKTRKANSQVARQKTQGEYLSI